MRIWIVTGLTTRIHIGSVGKWRNLCQKSLSPSLRSQGFRNVYFAVVSGEFTDEGREAIRTLKIGTDIQEVRLVEAEALLALLENRLRKPEFDLGPGDAGGPVVQDFFAESGLLTAADVREELGI